MRSLLLLISLTLALPQISYAGPPPRVHKSLAKRLKQKVRVALRKKRRNIKVRAWANTAGELAVGASVLGFLTTAAAIGEHYRFPSFAYVKPMLAVGVGTLVASGLTLAASHVIGGPRMFRASDIVLENKLEHKALRSILKAEKRIAELTAHGAAPVSRRAFRRASSGLLNDLSRAKESLETLSLRDRARASAPNLVPMDFPSMAAAP